MINWIQSGIRLLCFPLSLLVLLASCNDDPKASGACESTVSQLEVQENFSALAEQTLAEALTATNELIQEVNDFTNALPADRNLARLLSSLKAAQIAWVYAEPFQYGPFGDLTAGVAINPFPVNEDVVDDYLEDGEFPSSDAPAFDRGFPALDYILAGKLVGNPSLLDDQAALAVVEAILSDIQNQQLAIRSAWENDSSFGSQTGTSAGSPFSVIINALSKQFEDSRRDRLGIPFGVSTLGFPNPQTVESPYGDNSLTLLLVSSSATARAYAAIQGIGVDDYVGSMGNGEGVSLDRDIKAQFQLIADAANGISTPLEEAVTNDADAVQQLYNALSRQVVFLKTDLPAVTCVAITYVDNPSDSD